MTTGKKSLYILIFICSGFLVAGLFGAKLFSNEIGILVILIPVAIGFIFAVRLKCSKCGFRLSNKFPVGGLTLLYFSNEKCPNCGEKLKN